MSFNSQPQMDEYGFRDREMMRLEKESLEQIYDKLSNMPQWEEGAAAYEGGMLRSFNPYEDGTLECRAWALGWEEAEECQDGE